MFIAAFSGCTGLGRFIAAGEKDIVTVDKSTHSTLILDVYLSVGSISLEVIPTALYLVDVVNKVSIREGSGGTLAEAEEVTSSEIDSDTMKIIFDSNDEGITVDYKYDLFIKVCNNISLQINLVATTGEINADLLDASVTVSLFDIETTTGSLTLSVQDVLMADSSPTIQTTTGTQDIIFTNINYTASTLWTITSSTGGIDVDLTDTGPSSSTSLTHSFDISCTTGGIDIISDLHQDIGVKITASVSTGTITLPGGGDSYTSSNFASATLKYDFSLATDTGRISFSD
jgi:hypothetical protein